MHFWSKFGESSLNGWQVILWKSSNGIKFYFQVKFDPEYQDRSTPKSIGILTILRCIFGPNLVTLAWTNDKLSCGQAQNEVKFDFQVRFDLEGQDRPPRKTIGNLTKVFCCCTPNLVILAWPDDELSCGQASDWYTHGHTDTQTQATTILKGQNWPG